MPLTNPANAIKHLYPGIADNQYMFRDDGQGIYLEYLDPALGDPPSDAELEAAEPLYQGPSYLTGGTREPGLSDIEQNLRAAYDYFRWRVAQKIKGVAARYGMTEIVRDSNGNFVEVGVPEKAAKYAQVNGSRYRAISNALISWESNVWQALQDQWATIDPRGDFTGFDGVTPPTWPMIEADIDTAHPEP